MSSVATLSLSLRCHPRRHLRQHATLSRTWKHSVRTINDERGAKGIREREERESIKGSSGRGAGTVAEGPTSVGRSGATGGGSRRVRVGEGGEGGGEPLLRWPPGGGKEAVGGGRSRGPRERSLRRCGAG